MYSKVMVFMSRRRRPCISEKSNTAFFTVYYLFIYHIRVEANCSLDSSFIIHLSSSKISGTIVGHVGDGNFHIFLPFDQSNDEHASIAHQLGDDIARSDVQNIYYEWCIVWGRTQEFMIVLVWHVDMLEDLQLVIVLEPLSVFTKRIDPPWSILLESSSCVTTTESSGLWRMEKCWRNIFGLRGFSVFGSLETLLRRHTGQGE